MADKQGNLWIAMEGSGIDIYNPNTKEHKHINSTEKTHYKGLADDDLQTVFIDSKEKI